MTPVLRVVLGLFLMAHGVAHAVGFAVPWKLVQSEELPYRTTVFAGALELGPQGIKAVGILWLLLAITVAGLGVALLVNRFSYTVALWIICCSLVLSIMGWPDARIGVAIDVALLLSLMALHQ